MLTKVSLLSLPAFAFLALFYAYPLGAMLRLSLARASNGVWAEIVATLTAPAVQGVIGFTWWQAALSTVLTLLVGLPGAYWLARYRFAGQGLFRALTAVPFVLPTLVVAAALNALIGPRGWVNLGLMAVFNVEQPPVQLIGTLGAILLAHVFYNTTLVLRMVGDFWARLDPRLGAAARVLGANRWQAFWHVTLPLLWPAILAAALLVFLFDFTSFGVILALGGPRFATLETEIYQQTITYFNLPRAALLALIQLFFTGIVALAQARLAARLSVALPLRSSAVTRRPLRGWLNRLGAGIALGLIALLLIAPLTALVTRSLTRFDADRGERGAIQTGLTFDYYLELTQNRRADYFYAPPTTAIANSLQIAGITVFLALLLGLPAAWALARQPASALTHALETGLLLPLGTSAVTLGLGLIVAFGAPPLDWRASPWLLPLAHTLVALPFVVRNLAPPLRALRPRVRHAAAVLGASPLRAWAEVEWPLVSRAVLAAAIFAFMLSLGEFGATALLARPDQPTLPLVIYRHLTLPGALNYGQALALSSVLALVCAVGIGIIESLSD